MNKKFKVFQLQSLDIWGNEKEGYEVNNVMDEGIFWESEEFPNFADIVKTLKRCGFLKKRFRFSSQYPYDNMEVIEYKNCPICQIIEKPEHNKEYGNWFTFGNFPMGFPAVVFRSTIKGFRKIKG